MQPSTRVPPVPLAPSARVPPSRWRDPRLVLGLLIVAGSVLLGSWVLAAADDTDTVWGVRGPLPAGSRIDPADLEPRRVRFADGDLGRYLSTERGVAGRTIARSVGAGELLPASALTGPTGRPGVQLPLTVEQTGLPGAVRPGSVVDVWVAPRDPDPGGTRARRVLRGVVVLEVPDPADTFEPVASRTVVVSVAADDDVADVLGAAVDGALVLTLRGEP